MRNSLEEQKTHQVLVTQSLYLKASRAQKKDKNSTGSDDFVLDDDDAGAADIQCNQDEEDLSSDDCDVDEHGEAQFNTNYVTRTVAKSSSFGEKGNGSKSKEEMPIEQQKEGSQ